MGNDLIKELQRAVEKLHNCIAEYVDSVAVIEKHGQATAWEGIVEVFSLKGHPQADKCYAWASPIEGSKKYRYYAVLHIPPVDSPQAAVRASIVKDYKDGNINKNK